MKPIGYNSQFCFIISSYNNEKNIETNLISLIAQTNTNWRCIYINDCSSDNTEVLFFYLVEKYKVKSKFTYIKNHERSGQMYSKYTAYKLVNDFEIVCILDGDDWLADNDVVNRLTRVYSDKNVQMVSSNYNIYYNEVTTKSTNFSTYSDDIINGKQFRSKHQWLVRHLKTGYGIFFKSIPKKYLTRNGEWLKVATDIAEYYSVLELSNGKYLAIDDPMYIYNKSNSVTYNTSYYREESKNLHKNTLEYILTLPPCKYSFPKTYIINMSKCIKKREYIVRQMLFQSNINFKFIQGIDGSIDTENGDFMKKYFEYMGVQTSSEPVAFDRSIILPLYKTKYNFKRQHITRGSLGLIQSAFVLMHEFVKEDTDHALILEDDVYTIKDLNNNLFINEELLKGKDLVYLGCHISNESIYPKNSDTIFIDVLKHPNLIYGTYSIIISKKLAQYILNLGIDTILRLNLSWDLLLNYIRNTRTEEFTFFLYFKEVFIPNVIKTGGINTLRDISFYTKNNTTLQNYYIPGVTQYHSENDIAHIISTHGEDTFFEFINKVVYINLDHRVDRNDHIQGQLLKYIAPNKILRFNAVKDTYGEIGCALSHIAVLEMAIAENWDNVFIAEDDLTWTNDFVNGYDMLQSLVEKKYDVIVLGGTCVKSYKYSFKLISCRSALAYIVNKTYYKTLLDCFKRALNGLYTTHIKSKYSIDVAWNSLQKDHNWYIIKPNMCKQLPSYSDIENEFKDYDVYFNEETSKSYEIDDPAYHNPHLKPTNNLSKFQHSNFNKTFNVNEPPKPNPYSLDKLLFEAPKSAKTFNVKPSVNIHQPPKEVIIERGNVPNMKFNVPDQPLIPKVFEKTNSIHYPYKELSIEDGNIPNMKFNVTERPLIPKVFEKIIFQHSDTNKSFKVPVESFSQTQIDYITEHIDIELKNVPKIKFNIIDPPIRKTVQLENIPFQPPTSIDKVNFNGIEPVFYETPVQQISFDSPIFNKIFNGKKVVVTAPVYNDLSLQPIVINNKTFSVIETAYDKSSKKNASRRSGLNLSGQSTTKEKIEFQRPNLNKSFIPTKTSPSKRPFEEIMFEAPSIRKSTFNTDKVLVKNTLDQEILFEGPNLKKFFDIMNEKSSSNVIFEQGTIDPISVVNVKFSVTVVPDIKYPVIKPPLQEVVFERPNLNKSFNPDKKPKIIERGPTLVSLRQLIGKLKTN